MSKKSTSTSSLSSLKSQLARALADYANLEKRFERDSSAVIKYSQAALLTKLLTFHDHLALAAKSLKDQSLLMLISELDKIFKEEGVISIPTAGPFDPSFMECTELVPGEKDTIIKVIRSGYRLHDRVLRPARVQLGNGELVNSSQ